MLLLCLNLRSRGFRKDWHHFDLLISFFRMIAREWQGSSSFRQWIRPSCDHFDLLISFFRMIAREWQGSSSFRQWFRPSCDPSAGIFNAQAGKCFLMISVSNRAHAFRIHPIMVHLCGAFGCFVYTNGWWPFIVLFTRMSLKLLIPGYVSSLDIFCTTTWNMHFSQSTWRPFSRLS